MYQIELYYICNTGLRIDKLKKCPNTVDVFVKLVGFIHIYKHTHTHVFISMVLLQFPQFKLDWLLNHLVE